MLSVIYSFFFNSVIIYMYVCMYVYMFVLSLIECKRPTLLRTNNLDGKQQQHLGDEKREDLLVMESGEWGTF